jgi:hypothetical protein
MIDLKKSLRILGSVAAVGGMIAATPMAAMAQGANPCAPKAQGQSKAKAANPCAAKAANPCAPKAANPCAPKK